MAAPRGPFAEFLRGAAAFVLACAAVGAVVWLVVWWVG